MYITLYVIYLKILRVLPIVVVLLIITIFDTRNECSELYMLGNSGNMEETYG